MADLPAAQTLSMVILSEADWFRLDKLFHKVFGHSLDARLANYKVKRQMSLLIAE